MWTNDGRVLLPYTQNTPRFSAQLYMIKPPIGHVHFIRYLKISKEINKWLESLVSFISKSYDDIIITKCARISYYYFLGVVGNISI